MAGKGKASGSGPRGRGGGPGEGKVLKERYRTVLVEKLTPADLEELQGYLRNEFDEKGNLKREYRDRFEWKLRQFLHEEILTREIVGLEALIRDLRPGDLKR
jgi:hypothetical protein